MRRHPLQATLHQHDVTLANDYCDLLQRRRTELVAMERTLREARKQASKEGRRGRSVARKARKERFLRAGMRLSDGLDDVAAKVEREGRRLLSKLAPGRRAT